jgi:hypothetical protein
MSQPDSSPPAPVTWPDPYTPAHAAQDAALRLGVVLPHPVAVAVAAAVLECADDEYRAEAFIAPEFAGVPDAMKALERRLRQKLAYDLAEAELLPTALPRKVVTRASQLWEPVKVELVVPVRRALRL